VRPYLEKTLHKKLKKKKKKGWGRMVEWLKVKALSLNPSTAKKIKNKK
jgi:hypothetical protein